MQCVRLISFQQNLTIYTRSVHNSISYMAEPMICYVTSVYSIFAVDEILTLSCGSTVLRDATNLNYKSCDNYEAKKTKGPTSLSH
jgi:hypothetical protein